MGALGIVALLVQLMVVGVMVGLWLALAIMPGRIAHKRGHPQAEAISVCGWIGALTMGVISPLAFIWAYYRPLEAKHRQVASPEAKPGVKEGLAQAVFYHTQPATKATNEEVDS